MHLSYSLYQLMNVMLFPWPMCCRMLGHIHNGATSSAGNLWITVLWLTINKETYYCLWRTHSIISSAPTLVRILVGSFKHYFSQQQFKAVFLPWAAQQGGILKCLLWCFAVTEKQLTFFLMKAFNYLFIIRLFFYLYPKENQT